MSVIFGARGAAFACLAMIFVARPLSAEELSLGQALELATANNPTIAAGRLAADAARRSAVGARALTNPEIVVAPSVVGDAGSDSAVLFSQPLEINGSRRVRGEIASHEATAAGLDAEAKAREVLLRVGQAYWDVARAQELVKLNQDNLQYLETIRGAVQKQYDVGTAPGSQILKMDVELARARQEFARAELDLSASKAELANLIGRHSNTEFTVSEPLAFQNIALDRNALKIAALANRPEVKSAQSQVAAAGGQVKAARLRRAPDLALQARRETFDPGSDGGVAIAVSLPLLDWGSVRADEKGAAARVQSLEKQLEATKNEVALEVELAVQRESTASRIVRDYQGEILEKSEELATMARKGYEKGASSYLDVLEAQRTLRSVRSEYYSALAEHAKALTQLDWAVGSPVSRKDNMEVKR